MLGFGKVWITIILLIAAIILAFVMYSRIMTLIATKFITDFLRQELGEAMGKSVVIRKINWSLLGKITLYDVKLSTVDKGGPVPIIEADEIQTDLTVWDIFFKKIRRPLGKVIFIKPRLYFGTKQQSFLSFYNPLAKRGIRHLLLPRLYIQEGEVIVLEPEQKAYFTLKTISGFIDPTIPMRTRISLSGKPEGDEYSSFSFSGTLNLLTLAHNLRLKCQGLRLSNLKGLVGGIELREGIADVDLKLLRKKEYPNPWAGYTGDIKIDGGVATLKNKNIPFRFEGFFKLRGRDFVSEKFFVYLGESKLMAEGRLFFFGEPEMDISFKSDSLEIEDFLAVSSLSTAPGAQGKGRLALRASGKMREPIIEGEISFPDAKAFSTPVTDISLSFSGSSKGFKIKRLTMNICGGYFTASGRVSEGMEIMFDLKKASLYEICNILAYSGFMVNPTLRNYCSQLQGKVDLSGKIQGMLNSPRITGFFSGRDIVTTSQRFTKSEARFEYSKEGLKFTPLTLGNEYQLWSDYYSYDSGRKLELTLQIDNADVESLVRDLELKVPSPFTGQVSGKVELTGDIERIKSKGHLTVEQGTISEIHFEKMDLIFSGIGKEIDIEDSSISQEKGKVLIMRGKLLLGGGESPMEIKPSPTGFVWEGWNIEKDVAQMEFNMGRNISKNWYLSFSTPVDNIHKFPLISQPPRPDTSEKAELQYRLDDERRLKLRWKDKEEFIGLEHRFRF